MLCENCGEKPATLHFTKIINGQKNEMHLCEQCAKEKGEIIPTDTNVFSFPQLLSGLLNFDQMVHGHSPNTSMDPLRCKNCGLTFNQFKKTGKFGCSDCYQYFEPQLEPIFRRIHGNSQHSGKVPTRTGGKIKLKKELRELKDQLQKKIALEEFEEAAKIRDKIKELELKLTERRG
ncbi:UvrB/UvrC motif-containing protein [Tepidibacillus infernus]|uniref:UVR domain-containing protein n=1 Tax=Tepidibacillus decaturensis TaxID=1413211 RepID=A0A135L7D3_9BACI|nr:MULTISPECIES: UvrB/UvrC motif-containing protein [Tepidibacillus]KXG44869.1 hypothetical protein U473_13230 [Tepidibacillus decaturensis]GBF12003.1 hypothetical protein HK1_02064 [Tepidibacillus sp. HK-1]